MSERAKLVFLYIKKFLFNLKTWLILLSIPLVLYLTMPLWKTPLDFFGATSYRVKYDTCCLIVLINIVFMFIFLSLLQKLAQKIKLNEILFLIIFFSLLFLPAMKLNKNTYSDVEKRPLAKFKPLFTKDGKTLKINNNFGKDFENAFNDRFWGRNGLICLYRNTFDFINRNHNSNRVIVDKKNGWFFLKKEVVQTYSTPTNRELSFMKENLNKFDDFCKSNGIKLYFVFTAEKSNIYQEYLPFYNLKNKDTLGRIFDRYLKESNDADFEHIFVEKEFFDFKKTNNQRLFFSTDNHYTNIAGFIVYKTVMNSIKKDFTDIKISDITDFDEYASKKVNWSGNFDEEAFGLGYLNETLYNDEKYLDYHYLYFKPKPDSAIKYLSDNGEFKEIKINNINGKYNVLLLGSSYVEATKLYFANSFKNTIKIRLNNSKEKNFHVSRFEKYIMEKRPDVLVVLISEFELFDYISTMYDDTKELEP